MLSCTFTESKSSSESNDTLNHDSIPEISELDTVPEEIDSVFYNIMLSPKGNYYSVRNSIKQKQNDFKKSYLALNSVKAKDSLITLAGNYIEEAILNEIIPFWYGTLWDFSGYTHKPNDGYVGCSYFVSTTLKHSGFNLNRYHLAQQSPLNEAKSLQISDSVLTVNYVQEDDLVASLEKKLKNGLYFIGLDSHVGYLLIRKSKAFFINSTYLDPLCVEIRYAEGADVFGSNIYYIVPISENKPLIKKWILGEELKIVRKK